MDEFVWMVVVKDMIVGDLLLLWHMFALLFSLLFIFGLGRK